MNYDLEHIAQALKNAREAKGLSQRELGAKAGVPQSHISKIENGAVDLRFSSLISLSRVLGLEITLVPKKALPAVKSIVQSSERTVDGGRSLSLATKELWYLQRRIDSLYADYPKVKSMQQLQHQIKMLKNFTFGELELGKLRAIVKEVRGIKALDESLESLNVIREISSQTRHLRNRLAHVSSNAPNITTVRPAYSLDEADE